jgi:hypothetical protein
MSLLKSYFDTEGPFGLPMKDKQAKSLEARLKDLPKDDAYSLRRLSLARGLTELSQEGRCDVSWITEESPDRLGDIVLSRGMDDSHFQLNPIVTLNHQYDQAPVGRSLWRKRVKEGALVGIKAKTHYPPRPENWAGDWRPDMALELVKAGLLGGKSIGFIPLKMRAPSAEEMQRQPGLQKVRYIIEEWLLAEYACCFLPLQPNSVVEQVTKSLQLTPELLAQLQTSVSAKSISSSENLGAVRKVAFLTLDQIYLSMASANFSTILEKSLQLTWPRP